ncbi:MAG: CocE/NonD family hydrolase [Bryobacteraceae bacterium]
MIKRLLPVLAISLASTTMLEAVSEAKYKVRFDNKVRVRMRDGVEIAAVVARPDAEGKFPAIMSYTPYRRVVHQRSTHLEREYNHHIHGTSYFAERGYVVVYYDVRGTGNSGGSSQDIYSDDERRDAHDMVEWIAAQPWCTGKVGMWGMSYGGVVQWQVGVQQPPHLATLVVGSSNDDVYLDWTWPGGSLRPYMFDSFSPLMTARNFAPPDLEIVGDKWSDLWNERLQKNSPWGIGYIRNPVHGNYWTARSLQPDYSRIKVPIMLWSGWADCYPTPILRAFSRINVPKKVYIGPWGHWWPEMALPGPRIDFRYELLRWYDYWLKGIRNDVMDEPPITLWVRNWKPPAERMYLEDAGFWRHEKEWPLQRTDYTTMHLGAGGKLSREAARAGQNAYVYDATVGVASGIYWGGGVLPFATPIDQRVDEAHSLTYTSEPLSQDTEVTGNPTAVLHVASTADTAYFHVKINDLAPDGTSKWIADGGVLATHRNSHSQPEPLEPGRVYELKIEMKYMAYVFPAGHRIRFVVASADFQNAWPAAKAATNTIHTGGNYDSRVILPFAPAQNPKLPAPRLKPSPRPPQKDEEIPKAVHEISQDLVNQTVTVTLESVRDEKSEDGKTKGAETTHSTYTVSRTNPADAVLKSSHKYTIVRADGTYYIEANEIVASDLTSFRYLTEVEVTIDGKRHFNKSWKVSVPRRLN